MSRTLLFFNALLRFMLNEILVLVFVLAAGIIGSMIGVGGGFIIVPMLVLILDFSMHEAVSTSLASICGISLSSFLIYARNGRVNYKLGVSLELFTFSGAIIGSLIASRLSCRFLEVLFSLTLIYVSFMMYRKTEENVDTEVFRGGFPRLSFAYLSSFLAGFIASMIGIGGGVLKVPVMNLILNVPIKIAIGTSEFMIFITSLSSTISYHLQGVGNLYHKIFGMVGGFIGGQVGSRIGLKTKSHSLRRIFVAVLLCFSVLMMIKGLTGIPL